MLKIGQQLGHGFMDFQRVIIPDLHVNVGHANVFQLLQLLGDIGKFE